MGTCHIIRVSEDMAGFCYDIVKMTGHVIGEAI